MPDTPGLLIFPAAHIGSMELLYTLKSMNLDQILGIYTEHFVQRCSPPGTYLVDDFASPAGLLANIEGWRQTHKATFSALIGIDDEEQFEFSAWLARHYDLDFYAAPSLRTASNKYLMKLRFVEQGVLTARFALISDAADPAVDRVRFPNVLKMLASSGSEFITVNLDRLDLARHLAELQAAVAGQANHWFRPVEVAGQVIDPRRQFLLEEFLAGQEYSCDFMLARGQVRIIRVVKKYPANHTGYFRGFYLMNEASIRRCGIDLGWLQEICTRIGAALDITEGVCMVDFMCTASGLQVIETSVRPGLSTFIPLMQQIYGYTSLSLLARFKQRGASDCAIPAGEGIVVHIIAPGPGLLTRFDTARAWGLPGVIDVHCYNMAGDTLIDSPHDHWDLLLGYVLIRDPQPDGINEIFSSVASAVDVQVHPLSA